MTTTLIATPPVVLLPALFAPTPKAAQRVTEFFTAQILPERNAPLTSMARYQCRACKGLSQHNCCRSLKSKIFFFAKKKQKTFVTFKNP